MIHSGASRAACQSLKRSVCSDWGFSGTWLDQLQRRTITVSSLPLCDHHLIGGDLLVDKIHLAGSDRWGRSAPELWGQQSTRLGGRHRTGILGIKSSVRQRSARSSPLREGTLPYNLYPKITSYNLYCLVKQFCHCVIMCCQCLISSWCCLVWLSLNSCGRTS